jgi:hypothetical protein
MGLKPGQGVLERTDFLQLVEKVGATPSIEGCYGSEGPGSASGPPGYLKLQAGFELTPSGEKAIRVDRTLGTDSVRLSSLKQAPKADIENFIEQLPMPH